MDKITLHLEDRNSSIYFSDQKKGRLGEVLRTHFKASRWVLVTNPVVNRLYGSWVRSEMKGLGKVETILMPDGERYKTLKTVEKIYRELSRLKADRHTPVIALGGGVVGDVAGFAAASYLRGVPLVQIPTTLLAQVDSSVGGKTGVDLPTGKNLVGAFYQPHVVFIDVSTLATLPRREVLCGAAEVIKYGAIRSERLFGLLEKKIHSFLDLEPQLLKRIVKECVRIKADVVRRDEKETLGLRMILNFGHTLGHAVETLSGYKRFSHGEGVAIGMAFAARLSQALKLAQAFTVERLINLLHEAGLPFRVPSFPRKAYLEVMARDKKVKNGKVRYVLIKKVGAVTVKELSLDWVGKNLKDR
ncbi:MAG: 3-dehydroquinate synthase [bacterium]